MEKVAGSDDPNALKDMQSFIDAFSPILAEAHKFLVGAQTAGSRGARLLRGSGLGVGLKVVESQGLRAGFGHVVPGENTGSWQQRVQ